MVGGATERGTSPPPTTGVVVSESAHQAAGADNLQASVEGRRPDPSPATEVEQPEGAQDEGEATAEAGIVDIANILGTPTVTVVRSTL
jgi:hypothetical protein